MLAAPTVRRTDARPRRRRLVPMLVALATVVGVLGVAGGPAATAAPDRPAAQAAAVPDFEGPGIPVRPASERYVREAYGAILGRDAEASGLTFWGDLLDASPSRAPFVRMLVLSRESVRRHALAAYEIAGQEPSDEELDDTIAALQSRAVTIESLLVTLLSSDAYYEDHGQGTDDGFVDALYEDLLGRPANGDGGDYWRARLAAGDSRRQVVRGFVYSLERLRPTIDDAYLRVLGRASDASGRDYWADRIRTGLSILDVDRHFLASVEAWGAGCSTLDRTRCLLPFPNDELTLPDATTETGRRVVLKPTWVPAPVGGPAFDPREWNRQDGFSPGSALLIHNGGIDPEQSGLPPLTDIGASLEDDSPVVIVDMETGERWPFWAELDANAADDADRALVIRPARNFLDGHRYAVGIGAMKDAAGATIAASPGFQTFRDELASSSRYVEERRPMIEEAIDEVVGAGLDRDSLHLSWSFTVASTENLAERAVHMRDEVLGGEAGTVAPEFTVTNVEPGDDQTTRVEGTYEVPKYLTGTGAPGSRLNLGSDDLPEADGTYTAPFVCTVPDVARTEPARPSLYGHGLLGTGGQSNGGYHRAMGRDHNVLYCGTDYIGMSASDVPNTLGIVQNLSRFPELVDRNQQGLLNFLVLGRLMTLPDGLESDPAFQGAEGEGVIDNSQLYWDGISQGGIMGGAVVALSTDITRGALGVPAINYSTLLERSVDFDPFFDIMAPKYPSALDRIMMISVIQMLWDRGEGNGYANHLTTDPLPGAPTHEVLLHPAFGDHQVAPIAADVYARTVGAATNDPPLADGRLADVTPLWGIDRIETWPHDGSAIIYWDSGAAAPPIENIPAREGEDPHGDPRADPDARRQISGFFQPDGTVEDVCNGTWCPADGVLTP